MTRPRGVHQTIAGRVFIDVAGPFDRGRGGPGGWWIVPEPGIELPGTPEVSPDIAGWCRERLAMPPREGAFTSVPDWVCEVLSPTTRRYDLLVKRSYYARVGIGFLWIVDAEAQTLSVDRLENGHWLELGVYGDETAARLPPFEAVETNVAEWWLELPTGVAEGS